jgi:MFS family permease
MTLPAVIARRERAGTNPGPDRRHSPAVTRGRRATLPRAGGFWLVAAVLVLLFVVAAAPSPLYGVYQAQWRFSAITLTEVFAVYALFLLVTLLVFGSVSDYLGRRRVILAGLVMTAAACGLFLAARSVDLLSAARALNGAAVGTAVSALGAALIDLQPEGSRLAPVLTTAASLMGLAAGGLAPAPWSSTVQRLSTWSGGCCSA